MFEQYFWHDCVSYDPNGHPPDCNSINIYAIHGEMVKVTERFKYERRALLQSVALMYAGCGDAWGWFSGYKQGNVFEFSHRFINDSR